MVQRQGIGERLAGGLNGEVVLVVPNGVPGKVLPSLTLPKQPPLSIRGAEADSPLVGVTTSQLWDVVCWSSSSVASAPAHWNPTLSFAFVKEV